MSEFAIFNRVYMDFCSLSDAFWAPGPGLGAQIKPQKLEKMKMIFLSLDLSSFKVPHFRGVFQSSTTDEPNTNAMMGR